MVELQHRTVPTAALCAFNTANPSAAVADFGSKAFTLVKRAVKADLNADQDGLCVYCESKLAPDAGHVEHIKPKAGEHARPDLCFTYTNFAHSCDIRTICGHRKRDRILLIEPAPGCNAQWALSTDGTIEPIAKLSKQQNLAVRQTLDILGLNADSNLVDERQRWFARMLEILRETPTDIHAFLHAAPFRHILATAL